MPRKQSFEASLAELETIIQDLERGELPLDKMMEQYEKGVKALALCRRILDDAEKRIEILVKAQDGQLKPEPFQPPPQQ